jgi:hypothetical protein
MRFVAVAVVALTLMGFTKADAEKSLNGKWAGRSNDISIVINRTMNYGFVYRGGQIIEGELAISEPVARAVIVKIGQNSYVVHIHESGDTIGFSNLGEKLSWTLRRVEE